MHQQDQILAPDTKLRDHIDRVENLIIKHNPSKKYTAFARFFMSVAVTMNIYDEGAFQVIRDSIILGEDETEIGFEELVHEWESCLNIKYGYDYKCCSVVG